MSTATMPRTERPLPPIPGNANKSDVWRDKSGNLEQHAVELPVDKQTYQVNGKLYACITAACTTAEWVIAPRTEPKAKHCPVDGQLLALVPLDDTDDDRSPSAGSGSWPGSPTCGRRRRCSTPRGSGPRRR